MRKDFDRWSEIKKSLEKSDRHLLFRAGEVWWCSVGINVSRESCGKGNRFSRPVLIIKKLSTSTFIGIPMTSKLKQGSWFAEVDVAGQARVAQLNQIRMFSTNRLQRCMAMLSSHDLARIKEELSNLLELSNHHRSRDSGSLGCPKCNAIIPDVGVDVNRVMDWH